MLDDVKWGIAGAFRMAQFRKDGMAVFDISADGFWNSFIAMPICAALQVVTLLLPAMIPVEQRTIGYLAVTAVATIVTLLVIVAAMLLMTKLIKRDDRFSVFVIVFNWCNVPMFCATLAMSLVEGLLMGGGIQGLALLLAFIYTQVFTWFVLRETLNIDMLLAFLLTVFILALQLLVNFGIGWASQAVGTAVA